MLHSGKRVTFEETGEAVYLVKSTKTGEEARKKRD